MYPVETNNCIETFQQLFKSDKIGKCQYETTDPDFNNFKTLPAAIYIVNRINY